MSETGDAHEHNADSGESHPAAGPERWTAGRFDLLEEVGSGSSGTVYRARLREPYRGLEAGALVAVKFLRQDRIGDERSIRRILEEGSLGQRVSHPNVAAIYGAERLEILGMESVYLVMEFVSGTTLRGFLKTRGRAVEDLVRRIGADAASGLHALHRRGIVHRDVKPENLVLTAEGLVKIVDLGLAKPFGAKGGGSAPASGSSSGGGIAGSVAYTAPETLRGHSAVAQTDLYSLGVVLFEIATGAHPFQEHRDADSMIHAHLFEEPARPSHHWPRISPLLDQLILELLAKDPAARPPSAADVARRLSEGERSEWWRRHLAAAPVLSSRRRLRGMRRPAETRFFDRETERRVLTARLDQARAGRGSVVVLCGPVGIGRRRLCDEVMADWIEREKDLLFLGGSVEHDLGHAEPFAGTLLDWLLRGEGRNSPRALQRAAHRAMEEFGLPEQEAGALAAVAAGGAEEPPEVRADRLASAFVALAGKGHTVVLRVENAERLDTSGRLVMTRLRAAAPSCRLLVLAVTGPDGLLGIEDERVDLAGLDEESFLEFGRALFRAGEAPDAFLLQAHQALSGSPGNLIECLENLVLEGRLEGRPGDFHALAAGAKVRPAPPHLARFEARVASLPESLRKALASAAVLGDRCDLEDLCALSEQSELSILDGLSLFRGRVISVQAKEVAFRHRDFRLSLLRSLDDRTRADLHRRAAELLRRRGASALEIGMHLSRAGDHEACLEPLIEGLEHLVRAGSRRTSLRVAARVSLHLEQLGARPDLRARRVRFLLLAGEARLAAEQPEAAAALYREAEALSRDLDAAEEAGAALTGLATAAYLTGRFLAAVNLLELAHHRLSTEASARAHTLAAKAHGLHGRILFYLGQSGEALRHIQQALRHVPGDEVELRCNLQIDLARTEALRHHYPTALKTLLRVEQELQRRRFPRTSLRCSLYKGQVRTILGMDSGTGDLRESVERAVRLSLPTAAGRARLFLGESELRKGRVDRARELFRLSRQDAASGGDRVGEVLAAIHLQELGQDDADLTDEVEALAVPELEVAWNLLVARRAARRGEAEWRSRHLAAAEALAAAADLPLGLALRVHAEAGRLGAAQALLQRVRDRIPDRKGRKRFLAEWRRWPGT